MLFDKVMAGMRTSKIASIAERGSQQSISLELVRTIYKSPSAIAPFDEATCTDSVVIQTMTSIVGNALAQVDISDIDLPNGYLSRLVSTSAILRWILSEPERDVIVVDVRDALAIRFGYGLVDNVRSIFHFGLSSSISRGMIGMGDRFVSAPVRMACFLSITAILLNLGLKMVFGAVDSFGVAVRVTAIAVATLGYRNAGILSRARGSRSGQLVARVLKPPKPPKLLRTDYGRRENPGSKRDSDTDEDTETPSGGPFDE